MGSGSPSKPVQFGEAAFSLAQTGLRWLRPAPWAPSQDWPSRRGAGGASFKLRRPNALHSILALPNYAGPLVLGPARARQGWPSHRGARGRKVLSILGVSGHFPSTRHPSQPRRPVPSEPPGPRALLSTGPGSDPRLGRVSGSDICTSGPVPLNVFRVPVSGPALNEIAALPLPFRPVRTPTTSPAPLCKLTRRSAAPRHHSRPSQRSGWKLELARLRSRRPASRTGLG